MARNTQSARSSSTLPQALRAQYPRATAADISRRAKKLSSDARRVGLPWYQLPLDGSGVRKRRKNPPARRESRGETKAGRWTITATKRKNGARMFYAGGARLTTESKDAVKFASIVHAEKVKSLILADFPAALTKAYMWQSWPLA